MIAAATGADSRRHWALAIATCAMTAMVAWVSACSDPGIAPPPVVPQDTTNLDELAADSIPVLSNAIAENFAASAHSSIAPHSFAVTSFQSGESNDVVYVSLRPGSVPNGQRAIIQRRGSANTLTAAIDDGGLDPVPIEAADGDSIDVEIVVTGGGVLRFSLRAPPTRRPRVVRSVPPPKKKDVALNAGIVVVFSEPVAPSSLTQAVQLMRGTISVAGTVRLLDGTTTSAVFEPSSPLEPETDYRLVVTNAVRDLDGDALEAQHAVEFTTGSQRIGLAHFVGIVPSTTELAVGSQVQLRAMPADSVGMPVSGRPVVWSNDTPDRVTVSTSGLVTAIAAGEGRVRASVDRGTGTALIIVSASLTPVDSVEVSPASSTLPAGGRISMSALLRDAEGNTLSFRPVLWATSNPNVAEVESASGGSAVIIGRAPGTATISATSEGRQGLATIAVVTPGAYAQIDVANGHTCGVTADGWAHCWGWNAYGQLGIATVADAAAPVPVAGGLTFSHVSIGWGFSCGLTSDGAAHCWGMNVYGQLGIGTVTGPDQCPPAPAPFGVPCSPTPTPVSGGLRFVSIGVGYEYACGLTSNGAAYCWGFNSGGRLGVGVTPGPEECFGQSCSTIPRPVAGGHVFSSIAVGLWHSCGLTAEGVAYCWGANEFGELGAGRTVTESAVPVRVAGTLTFTALAAGSGYTCGLTVDGATYCWGRNDAGQLGVGTFTGPEICPMIGGQQPACSTVPVRVSGGLTWASISVGDHACGLTPNGTAYCWGPNWYGGLGIGEIPLEECGITAGNPPCSTIPRPVAGALTFATLSARSGHTCAVTTAGVAYCWGENNAGQLGIGAADQDRHFVPLRVANQP